MEKLFCNLIPYTRYEFEITVSPESENSPETPSSYYTSEKAYIIANTSEDGNAGYFYKLSYKLIYRPNNCHDILNMYY